MATTMFELVHRQRWAGLVERCSTNPDMIPLQDELGLTVLHWACLNNPTTRVVSALVHFDPSNSICCTRDANGMTPLHCACSCLADIEVIRTLLGAHPHSVLDVDFSGWNCLHYLFSSIECDDGDDDSTVTAVDSICKLLLQTDTTQQLATQTDNGGCSPLEILWNRMSSNPSTKMNEIARCTILASKHAHCQHNCADRLFAHVVATMTECPISLALHTFENVIDPAALDQLDWNCNNCLHAAISVATSKASERKKLVSKMIELNPKLVKQVNNKQRLPIQIAVERGYTWNQSVQLLLLAHPQSIRVLNLDPINVPNFFSRLQTTDASGAKQEISLQRLSVIYELLRSRPSIFPLHS